MPVGSHFENPCSRGWRSCLTFLHYPKALVQCLADTRHKIDYWMIPITIWLSECCRLMWVNPLTLLTWWGPREESQRACPQMWRRQVTPHSSSTFLSFFFFPFLYLAVPGLSCSMQDLFSCSMWALAPWSGTKPEAPPSGAGSLSH